MWTSLLGWWGFPWGPIWSFANGITNASGGTREPDFDEALLWRNAVAFAAQGEGALAIGLSNILRKSDDAQIAQSAAEIIRFFSERGLNANTKLKDVWRRSPARSAALFATAFLVPGSLLALVSISSKSESQLAKVKPATPTDAAFDELFGANSPDATSTVAAAPPQATPAAEPTCDAPPSNGELLVDHRGDESSGHQLEIDNGTAGDAIIKVRDVANNRALASFFVSRGQSATLRNIPDGEYAVQYAVGDNLAANCRTFVNDGTASASEFPGSDALKTRYEELPDGTRIIRSRMSYTLYSVPNGNVRPNSIDMVEFNKP